MGINLLGADVLAATLLVTIGVISQWRHKNEWGFEWERLFVALLEVAFGLYLIERIDGWIILVLKEGAK